MDEPSKSEAPAAGESATAAAPEPLTLRRGARIRLGTRAGVVDQVRGAWKRPYDVRVRWDGEKYPVFITFESLELEHEKGRLKVE